MQYKWVGCQSVSPLNGSRYLSLIKIRNVFFNIAGLFLMMSDVKSWIKF
jgi:hypothetical protein